GPSDLLVALVVDFVDEITAVPRPKHGDRDAIAAARRHLHLSEQIIEGERHVLIVDVAPHALDQALASRYKKGRLTGNDGPFEMECSQERRNAGLPTEAPIITGTGAHVDHGGEPPGVPGAETPGEEIHAIDDLCRKSRIESKNVEGLVDDDSV